MMLRHLRVAVLQYAPWAQLLLCKLHLHMWQLAFETYDARGNFHGRERCACCEARRQYYRTNYGRG